MIRTWICAALLVLAPLVAYWPTVFHEYGYRDDYAHLRETHETPEKLWQFTSSYGRPVYGALLIASVRPLDGAVANLQWLRLTSVLLLGAVGIALWRILQRNGWSPVESAVAGVLVTFLPAAQVTVGWSIAWPIVLSILLALAGFRSTEAALARSGRRRWLAISGALAAYAAAALIYQPSAFFVVVPLAALLLQRADEARSRARWAGAHLGAAFGGVAIGFGGMQVVFALGLLQASGVMEIERNPLAKLVWFVANPLSNSLALFAVRDRFATPLVFWLAPLAVAALIAVGVALRRKRAPVDRFTMLFCVLVLPFVAFTVNLAAAVRVPSYRTTYGLAGLVVVLVLYALHSLREAGRLPRAAHYGVLAALVLLGGVLANRHAYTLIAQPQGWEWAIVRDAVRTLALGAGTHVYMIRPTIEDRATRRIFADEYGSLSSNSDWAAAEMFKSALRVRFPNGLPPGLSYTLSSGLDVPRPGTFDVVVDMRKLKDHRHK